MENIYTRTAAVLGDEGVERLKAARVLVVGIGGVGGYATEALARAGVGALTLVDMDRVAPSNLNRQIIATESTVGKLKVDAMMQRVVDINPECRVTPIAMFYDESSAPVLNFSEFDYVLDCIDSIGPKIDLIERASKTGTPIISAMGAGNKLDPTKLLVSDISKTHTDPLARAVRTRLRKSGINHLKVVFSTEKPRESSGGTVGSLSFVPSVMGLIMAGEVIREISGVGIIEVKSNK